MRWVQNKEYQVYSDDYLDSFPEEILKKIVLAIETRWIVNNSQNTI